MKTTNKLRHTSYTTLHYKMATLKNIQEITLLQLEGNGKSIDSCTVIQIVIPIAHVKSG
jgi:hypothetical protein